MSFVEAKLVFQLVIDANTPAPNPYMTMSAADKHTAKMEMLAELTSLEASQAAAALGSQPITIADPMSCELPDAVILDFIQTRFAACDAEIQAAFNCSLSVGPSLGDALCAKMIDCSHNCRRNFELVKSGPPPASWNVASASGVQGKIVIEFSFTTPPHGAMTMGGMGMGSGT
jgi:hypothetical protein